jgi:hypothetical protein
MLAKPQTIFLLNHFSSAEENLWQNMFAKAETNKFTT